MRAEAIQSADTVDPIVGGINLISTAQWLGSQKLLSRVALTSKWVIGSHYQKNLRRRLRLERVADGRLVIPCWVRVWCVELLYHYVGAVEVCFGAVHTLNDNVDYGQVRILPGAFQHRCSLEF